MISTLVGHSKRVNSVRWLSGKDIVHESELVSGSADGTICIWTATGMEYKCSKLTGHESNVNIVDGIYKRSDKTDAVVVSVSMDCTAIIWKRHLPIGKNMIVLLFLSMLKNTHCAVS